MRNAKGGGEGAWKGYVWGLLLLLARSEIWNMGQTRLGATVCKLICGQIFPRCQNYLCMMCNNCVHKFLTTFTFWIWTRRRSVFKIKSPWWKSVDLQNLRKRRTLEPSFQMFRLTTNSAHSQEKYFYKNVQTETSTLTCGYMLQFWLLTPATLGSYSSNISWVSRGDSPPQHRNCAQYNTGLLTGDLFYRTNGYF